MPSIDFKNFYKIIEQKVNYLFYELKITRYVVYTNGMFSKWVQSYLREIGATIEYIVDNNHFDGKNVLSLEAAAKKNNNGICFLVSSWNPDFHDELLQRIYQVIPKEQVFDLFPKIEQNDIDRQQIENILHELDQYFGKGQESVRKNIEISKDRIPSDLRSHIIVYTDILKKNYSVYRRKAYALAAYFRLKSIEVKKNDLLAGNLQPIHIMDMYPNIETEIQVNEKYSEIINAVDIGLFTRAPGAHMIPNYARILREGLQVQVDKIAELLNKTEQNERDFYESELILLLEFQKSIQRYENSAREHGNVKLETACRRIVKDRPEHFLDAVQLLLFLHEGVLNEAGSGSISFGRLDQYLYPYYKKDIESGYIQKEEAQNIIIELWKKISQYEMSWQNVTIGGGDSNGNDASNDLTIMCLKAAKAVRTDQPQLSLRIPINGMKQEVWDEAFELIQLGMGFPEIYNDKVAIIAKENAGVSHEDAIDYGIVGCVEITAGGKEYSHTEAARINWMKILELMLNQGKCMLTQKEWKLSEYHELTEFQKYEEFEKWYHRELTYFIQYICELTEDYSKEFTKYWPVPFTSILMDGCIENAKDVTDCGSIYNNLTLNSVGVASVANSLEAIENIVFKEKRISLTELSQILNRNYEGYDEIRFLLQGYSKYGNDIDSVDKKLTKLVNLTTETLARKRVKYSKGKWQAGFYTSYFHATMGALTGASADGRKEKEALSSSLSPMAGTDKEGPIALLNSANKIDMEQFGNGTVLDMKFLPIFWNNLENRQAVQKLINTYFERGGMEIQFNVVDRKTLIAAKENPMKHRNLVVRVSGFSAYFVTLEENLQNEIINRTEVGV